MPILHHLFLLLVAGILHEALKNLHVWCMDMHSSPLATTSSELVDPFISIDSDLQDVKI